MTWLRYQVVSGLSFLSRISAVTLLALVVSACSTPRTSLLLRIYDDEQSLPLLAESNQPGLHLYVKPAKQGVPGKLVLEIPENDDLFTVNAFVHRDEIPELLITLTDRAGRYETEIPALPLSPVQGDGDGDKGPFNGGSSTGQAGQTNGNAGLDATATNGPRKTTGGVGPSP